MATRTVAEVEDEMRAESVQPHPDDAKLYTLQAERDALKEATPGATPAGE